jgi:RNA polymerase sigma factor (sigma-70 family)
MRNREHWPLIRRWQTHRCQKSINRLLAAFDRHIEAVAMGYGPRDLEDRIQLAKIGFIKGVERFDFAHDVKIWTYVRHWVKAEIGNDLAHGSRSRRRLKRGNGQDRSLDRVFEFDDGDVGSYHDLWCADLYDDDEIVTGDEREALTEAIGTLTDRERRIIEGRHLADAPMTLAELGAEIGVSLQRVQQIEVGALAKVKTAAADVATAKARYAHGVAKQAFSGHGNKLSRCALNYRTEFEAMSPVVAPYRGRAPYPLRLMKRGETPAPIFLAA